MARSNNKKLPRQPSVGTDKKVIQVENPQAYYDKTPTWYFKNFDESHPRWGAKANMKIWPDIIAKLKAYESMCWREIDQTRSGRRANTRNHFISLAGVIPEARSRCAELFKEQYADMFSLAINSRCRLWGILENGVFMLVWVDSDHSIYPLMNK